MMFSVSTAIVFRLFSIRDRGKTLGFLGSTVAVGGMLGPVIGGVLVGTFGWQSIFIINVPIGLFAAAAAIKFLRLDETLSNKLRLDLMGAFLWIVMMASLVLALGEIGNTGKVGTNTAILLVVLLLALLLFIRRERRIEEPLLDSLGVQGSPLLLTILSMVMFFISMNMVTILGLVLFRGCWSTSSDGGVHSSPIPCQAISHVRLAHDRPHIRSQASVPVHHVGSPHTRGGLLHDGLRVHGRQHPDGADRLRGHGHGHLHLPDTK